MDIQVLIKEFILNYGLISIFIIVALEYANFPLPSEIVLPFVGIISHQYDISLALAILVSITGGIFGSLINYFIGYRYGNPLVFKLKEKFPKSKKAIKESYRWMDKYENMSVMYSRLIPLARTVISLVAGVTKMDIRKFIIFSTVGITIWNTVLIMLGYIVGDNMHKIESILGSYSKLIIVIILLTTVVFLVSKKKKNNINDEEVESN